MRTRFFTLVTFVTFALLGAVGQIVPTNPVNTQQITMPVFTLNPAPASGATIQISGNPGPQTIFYWVVANYPIGAATLSGPFAITKAPNTLSVSNFVMVAPILPTGATTYDLLKTSSTVSPTGACACAVATAVPAGTVTNDQSNSTGAYTVNPVNMNAFGLTLQNEVQSAGVSHLILRQNGAFVADLSNPTAGGTAFGSITSGINTVPAAMQLGTGSSLSPLNLGQNAGNQAWFRTPPIVQQVQGNFSATLTGGNIGSGQLVSTSYSLNSVSGESIVAPAFAVNLPTAGCTSGGTCTLTIAPPSLPSGYLSWNAYFCDTASACTTPQKVTACIALSGATSCTITSSSPATSGGMNFLNTSILQPSPNLQASDCPTGVTQPQFFEGHTNGNWYTTAGMDQSTNNTNTGIFNWCHQIAFTDLGWQASSFRALQSSPPSYDNSMVIFNHDHSLLSQTNQNRMLGGLSLTPVGFAGTLYAAELMQFEMDKNCNGCSLFGSPDGEFTLGSFQMQDNSVTNTGTSLGTNVLRLQFYKAGNGYDTGGMNVINSIFQFNNLSTMANVFVNRAQCTGAGSITAGCHGYYFLFNNTMTFNGYGESALYAQGAPGGGTLNFFLRQDGTVPSWLNGVTTLAGINANNAATLPVNGSVAIMPSVNVAPASTSIGANSVSCTGGASTYSYQLVGVDSNGGQVVGTPGTSCTTGVNPLTPGNPASIVTTPNSSFNTTYSPFARIDVYRVAGPMATGKIGSLTCTAGSPSAGLCATFLDTGLAASGALPTPANTTGGINAAGLGILAGNACKVTADITLPVNTATNVCSWSLPAVAQALAWQCQIPWVISAGTGTNTISVGVNASQTPTGTTNVMGEILTSNTSAGTEATVPLSASGPVNVLTSGTITPAATVFQSSISGTLLASGTSGTFAVTMTAAGTTATAAAKAGATCWLY